MVINGHLKFHSSSTDELQNVVIEKVAMGNAASAPSYDATSIGGDNLGRLLFNTDTSSYWFYNSTVWVEVGSQALAENLRDAGGAIYQSDGQFDPAFNGQLGNVTGAADLGDVIDQLDDAITSAAGVDTLKELNDTEIDEGSSPTLADGHVFYYDTTGSVWRNGPAGATSGIQAHDAGLDALAAKTTTGFLVQTGNDTFTSTTLLEGGAGLEGIDISDPTGTGGTPTIGLDLANLAVESAVAVGDHLIMNDGVNNKKVTVADIAALAGTQIPLGDLINVADANQSGSGASHGTDTTQPVGAQNNSYFFEGNTGDNGYDVINATLGKLNNVASGVDSATDEDVLAFDGSAWTAITPSTMLSDPDVSIGDIFDVTITSAADNDLLQYNTATSKWENVVIGSASGIQPYDAGLAALATGGTGIVSMNGDTVYFQQIAVADTGRLTVSNPDAQGANPTLDLATVTDSNTGTFEKVTVDSYGRVTGTTPVVAGDITTLVDSTYVNVTGDSMSGNLVMGSGTDITLPDAPAAATDAVNKQYVDNLVSAGTSWIQPIENPDFVGVETAVPGSPIASGAYIAYGGSYPQTWGTVTDVAAGDLMHYTFGAWEKSNDPLVAGDNLLVGVWTGSVAGTLPSFLYLDDYARYLGGDPTTAAAWDFPYGRSGNHPGWAATGDNVDTITITGTDATASIKAGNEVTFDGNTFTVVSATFGTNTDVVVSGNPGSATDTIRAELRDGGTTTVLNQNDSHYGDTYLYSGDDNEWVTISGPGAIGAGVGLYYTGTVLNVALGAGVAELPSDEVGLDLESGKAVQLTSTATGGLLTFVLDGATMDQSGAGLKIADGGVTETQLNISVAGDGLEGGGGTPLAVDIRAGSGLAITSGELDLVSVPNTALSNDSLFFTDGSTPQEVDLGGTFTFTATAGTGIALNTTTTDTLTLSGIDATDSIKGVATFNTDNFAVAGGDVTIKAGGVNYAELAADANHIAVSDGTTATDVQLGTGTISITGNTEDGTQFGVATTNTSGTVNIVVTGGVNALDDVTEAAPASGDVLVRDGTDYKNRHISHAYSSSAAATTHVVNHDLGTQFVNVTVYDTSTPPQVIIPQSIEMGDAGGANLDSNIKVTFNTAIDCHVVVMGVAGQPTS